MKNNYLHIISFDVPSPPDYGGVIDVFYKLKSLHREGWKIILHCYEYGRGQAAELENYCEQIYYYNRNRSLISFLSTTPFIVESRSNKTLLNRLAKDSYPILIEGIHGTAWLHHLSLKNKDQFIRLHNREEHYYFQLSRIEKNLFKKIYLFTEALKLRYFEKKLQGAKALMCISEDEKNWFSNQGYNNTYYIPAFHPFDQVEIKSGSGKYLLYHGNLSVAENIKAVEYLMMLPLENENIELIIAGKETDDALKHKIRKRKHIRFVDSPSQQEMTALIQHAHIQLLPSFQQTGTKLKHLIALFSGRHVIINTKSGMDGELASLCHICETITDMMLTIKKLFRQPFSEQDIARRREVLESAYSNEKNAKRITAIILKRP